MQVLFESNSKSRFILGISKNLDSLKDIPPELIPGILRKDKSYDFCLLDGNSGNFFHSPENQIFAISVSYKDQEGIQSNLVFLSTVDSEMTVALEVNFYLTDFRFRSRFTEAENRKAVEDSSVFCRNAVKNLANYQNFEEMRDFLFGLCDKSKENPLWVF